MTPCEAQESTPVMSCDENGSDKKEMSLHTTCLAALKCYAPLYCYLLK